MRCRPEDGLTPVLVVTPIQDHPPASIIQRLEHEYALRTELSATWAARPLELRYDGGRVLLVLEDPGGQTLDRIVGTPFQIDDFLRVAIALSAAIGQAHARGLIHKDLKPANILVDTASSVRLTGFGFASRLPRERQTPAPPEIIAGTLAYMAPEQTGRMNRSVDARGDLYALGVTFYEMLTGGLPFDAADPMEWVHCHIARQPVPPDELRDAIPKPISAIVIKLLAKTAEERYQTATGLAIDLRWCEAEWNSRGRIEPFPLGARDVPDRLLIPERLYGREQEINALIAAFERVVEHGATALVLVSGYSGVGKSSVVNELQKALVPPRGLFASGKFDQYKRDIPYATLAQALRSLVRPLLSESEAQLERWRDALLGALGANGQLMVELVPELELVIGPQKQVADLPLRDAKNRFHMVFRRFLGVFARKEHALALFLDDLQWLDTATLDLLEHLVTHSEVRHLLVVGAYRDKEVGPTHVLGRTLAAIREAGAIVHDIVLMPLGLDDLGQLVADALHCAPERARPLAQLVHEKTAGNPFFAIQFLTALADENLLAFDRATPAWVWDIGRMKGANYTDNVVDFMAAKLNRLSAITQETVKQLACLGNVARIDTLTLVHGDTVETMQATLLEAVHAGLVVHERTVYRFLHDRIQQAAYSMIPDGQRAAIHLDIGRVLLSSLTADQLTEQLFEVANQFNRGAGLIADRHERIEVAGLALGAGRKAKSAAAYASASEYFSAGMALVDENVWNTQYELMYHLWFERAQCELVSGNFEKAEQLIVESLRRGASKLDQAAVYTLKVQLHSVKGEYPQAVESGLACLRLFGIDIPAHPSWEQVQAEYEAVWQTLGGRPIEDLIDLPLMADPEMLAAMQAFLDLTPASYMTDFNLSCLKICRVVTLSLQYGTSGASAHAYGYLGTMLGPVFHRYGDAQRLAKLGCDLVEKHNFIDHRAHAYYAMGRVAFWTQPIASAIDFMRTTSRIVIDSGELTLISFSALQTVTGLLLRNDPLDAVWRESEMALKIVREAKYADAADIILSQQRFIANMQGWTTSSSTFRGPTIRDLQDEAAFEALLTGDRTTFVMSSYWILKLKGRFLSGDYAEALAAVDKVRPLLAAAAAQIQLLDYFYYAALTVAACYENAFSREPVEWRDLLTEHCAQLREWAENYPPTFADKHLLVSAEFARIQGRDADAMRWYEEAIRAASDNGFIQNEGLAYEVAARFYAARGFGTIASAYLRNARQCYLRWGALGKVRQLEQQHPKLLGATPPATAAAASGTSTEQIDLGAVVRAAQALSGEIILDKVIQTLMTLALEHAGAGRGLLILVRNDTPQIVAEARTGHKTIEVVSRQEPIAADSLPEAILRTVIRTRESVILDDALGPNPFAADDYLRLKRVRSVLCLPLLKQAELIGALYLENNLASHVFTPARITILELLAAQAAISLENARLYSDLLQENRERRTAEAAMRGSEARWRTLFENVPVGVALVGSRGLYAEVNPAFCRMTGYSEAELKQFTPADITHEDDRAATEALISAQAAGMPYAPRIEKRYRRKDGGIIWVEVSAFRAPIMESELLRAAVAVDITERKRAETALRRSETYLTEAQSLSRTGSFAWNVSSGVIFWSEETFSIFGYDTALPATLEMGLQRIHPADLAFVQSIVERASRTGEDIDAESRLRMPDGTEKYVHFVGRALRDPTGELEFIGSVMDITAAKLAEESLHKAQADLAHAARVSALGELAASIAHEINQPLTAVATSGSACLRWLGQDPPDLEAARRSVSRIVKDAHHASDVIRSLRALAVKSGPDVTRLDINRAIQEVLALTRRDLQQHGVTLQTDLSVQIPPVMGDRVQLQQVLLNLIMNSVEAMATVIDRPKVLAIRSAPVQAGEVLVGVEDTGTGLDPATADRIFLPFYTTKSSGMGMGLSICRTIIEAHGGQVWAKPNAPQGAVFQFRLPAAGQEVF